MRGRSSDKRHKNKKTGRSATGIIMLVAVSLVLIIVCFSWIRLTEKKKDYLAQAAELEKRIEAEKARSSEIDAYEEYVGTNEYIEDMARERLGLAYPDEIIFTPRD